MRGRNAKYSSFLFCEPETQCSEILQSTGNIIAKLSLAILPSLAGISTPSLVSISCIPIILPVSSPFAFNVDSVALTEEAKLYIRGLLFASACQGSLAVCDIMLGDMTQAVIRALFAGLGWYVTRPEGLTSLASFTIVTFLSGSINGLAAIQMLNNNPGPLFSGLLPLLINYIRFADIVSPLLCLGSCYCAWMLFRELRRVNAAIAPGNDIENTQEITGASTTRRRPQAATTATEFRPFQGVGRSLVTNESTGLTNQ